ncbi:hypothetical protein K239x_15150 [Planctomycetes bacterium K23_9]|uniref:Uncharacterized protein n=1 Tax=Stieleria marina TaxID=1930275 RepID=A0A517NR14_9BACT|nr:hypothetical protein K239x_15150 [Planctomycetes bacterium K23_9]
MRLLSVDYQPVSRFGKWYPSGEESQNRNNRQIQFNCYMRTGRYQD